MPWQVSVWAWPCFGQERCPSTWAESISYLPPLQKIRMLGVSTSFFYRGRFPFPLPTKKTPMDSNGGNSGATWWKNHPPDPNRCRPASVVKVTGTFGWRWLPRSPSPVAWLRIQWSKSGWRLFFLMKFESFLEPQTSIQKWMFGETTISYVKIGNHPIETTIYKWLFGVPGYL